MYRQTQVEQAHQALNEKITELFWDVSDASVEPNGDDTRIMGTVVVNLAEHQIRGELNRLAGIWFFDYKGKTVRIQASELKEVLKELDDAYAELV